MGKEISENLHNDCSMNEDRREKSHVVKPFYANKRQKEEEFKFSSSIMLIL